jgi:hypothetical protein
MRHKNAASFLAFTLAAAVPLFADSIPGHSRGGSKYVTFSEGFTSEQNVRGGSAECNFLLGAPKEKGLSTSTIVGSFSSAIARGEKGSELGSGGASSGNSVHLVDFSGNNGTSSDKDKGKGKAKGKQGGASSGGNDAGAGNGGSAPVLPVVEPGSQSLLLVGLAGLGMVFFRRRTLTNAI